MNLFSKSCLIITTIVFSATIYSQQTTYNVDVMYPETKKEGRQIAISGEIEARQRARLTPLEAGLITAINVEIGDTVTQGQRLLIMDTELVTLNLASTKAGELAATVNLQEAKRLYKEAVELSEKQVIAATLIAQREAQVASANAQLARAAAQVKLQEAMVQRHALIAPFDGVIVERLAEVGEWATQQDDVLTLVSQQDLRVTINIPQEYYPFLSNRSFIQVEIKPDLPNSQAIEASLSRLVPVSNNMGRAFTAHIDLPSDVDLVPGMSAIATLTLPQTLSNEIILPRSAVKQHPDGGSSVFVVENNRAKRINTAFTRINNEQVSIPDPSTNLPFIITAVELLVDNAPVNIKQVRKQ